MSRSSNAIIPAHGPVRRAFLLKLFREYGDGQNDLAIADLALLYGVSYCTMHRWLDEAGVRFRRRGGLMKKRAG